MKSVKAVKQYLQVEKKRGAAKKSNLNEWGHIIEMAISDLTGENSPPFDN